MARTIELNGTAGNFGYKVTIEPSPEVEMALLEQGAFRVLQNKPTVEWEKSIAYPGDAKRPKDFKRNSIGFDEASAKALEKSLGLAKIEVQSGVDDKGEPVYKMADLGVVDVTVSEYVPNTGYAPKYQAEKNLLNLYLFEADGKTERKLKTGEARSATSFASSRGIQAPTEPWDEDLEFLKAVKQWQAEQAASQD